MIDEIRHIVEKHPKNYVKVLKSKGIHKHVKSNEKLIDFIYEHTKQLNDKHTFKTRLYWLLNGIESWDDERVCCKNCKKPLYDFNVAKLNLGYKSSCSKECERKLATKSIKNTMMQKYGVENAFQLDEVISKIKDNADVIQSKKNETHRKNNTFNSSKQEENICKSFEENNIDVKRNYSSKFYPFRCDFYIEDFDMYIELNASWTHGGRFFDENDDGCKKQLAEWKKKAETSDFYKNAIETWTSRDVEKKRIADKNCLNYKVFWSDNEFSEWTKSYEFEQFKKIAELKKLVMQCKRSYIRKLKSKTYAEQYRQLFRLVLESTQLLESEEYSFPTRVFWTLHNIKSFNDKRCCCSNCGRNAEHRNVRNAIDGYSKYCCKKCMHDSNSRKELYKETCMKNFGVENASQAQAIKDKKTATSMQNYGVSNPTKSHVVQNRMHRTMLKRYGVEHALQNNSLNKKAQHTTEKHYGVKHPMLSKEIRCKAQQKYMYDGIGFDSKPELALYIYLKSKNVDFEYQPKINYTYEVNGKKLEYFPDYIINGKTYEIKGRHFFKEDGTMQNPWCHAQDDIYEAKHQCMIENNVIILLDDDKLVEDAIDYVEHEYGKNYLECCKRTKK